MIRRWLEKFWGAWRGAAAAGAVFLALLALILLSTGTVPVYRLSNAARVLLGEEPVSLPPAPSSGEEEWRQLAEAGRQAEDALRTRKAEIDRLDAIVSARLGALEAERRRLDEARQAHDLAEARLLKRQEALAAQESDAELEANLPIFSRMDGVAILSLVKGWDDARLARYLRAMRPMKAAEVLEAMNLDPDYQARAGRLMDELRKPPGGGGP